MTLEIWKDIDGYEGLYQVSNLGRIKSLNYKRTGRTKILKLVKSNGYLDIILYNNGKCKHYLVHRLVAKAFIPNPDSLPEINHIDENKTNNKVDNLEWCTSKYNSNYGTKPLRFSKSRGISVKCIETEIVYHSAREAERQTGIDNTQIVGVCKGKYGYQTAGGYTWEYVSKQGGD